MWTQILPNTLQQNLAFQPNKTLALATYGDPFTVIALYPVGTPIRRGIIDSYQHVQKLLCIVGLCLCIPLIGFACVLRNPKLNEKQTLAEDSDEEVVR